MPNTSVSTYALPSEINGGSVSDDLAKARRVQQQVQMRLAEKSTLPRQNGSTSHYAVSDYGGSSSVKYNTYNPSFSSKSSFMYTGSRTIGPQVSHRSGFSSRSAAPDMAEFQRMTIRSGGGGGGGGGFYQEDMRMGGYQGTMRQRMDPEIMSSHSMRQIPMQMKPWNDDGSDAGSLISERDATFGRQYAQSTVNGYTSQVRQGGGNMGFQSTMRRSLSGTLTRGGGMTGGATEIVQQQSFKGPAHRTISRITNRNRMSMGSTSGTMPQMSSGGSIYGGGGDVVDQGFLISTMSGSQGNSMLQRQGTMSRAMSVKSMHSVGRGMDIFDGQMDMGASMGNLSGINTLNVPTALQYLREPEPELQVLGAAYIQHQCYSDNDAKNLVRQEQGIGDLVKLFNSDNQEVRRYATGAVRNIIYENMENKTALIEAGGIQELVRALGEPDDELHKNITGIMWNLSSKDTLKNKLATQTLSELTDKILIPLSAKEVEVAVEDSDSAINHESPSEAEIFCNTTGCLRNLSSAGEKTRQAMRDTKGLVGSLVDYIKASLKRNNPNEKGVENALCVLRNLSYQLYSELPQTVARRLEGATRDQDKGTGDFIGCFTPQSRKSKNRKNHLQTFTEVARVPKGMEWLWHPEILKVYNEVLQKAEINNTSREAAAGALQNITAGDQRWASVLSCVALDQEKILPTVINCLSSNHDLELRSLTGFLRNLSRHTDNKDAMAKKVVSILVEKLPSDGREKQPSSDVVINICGVLNNLVTGSIGAARDITDCDGLIKLTGIRDSHDNSPASNKTAQAAATVLSNMYHYKKLHKLFQSKGFSKQQLVENVV